MPKSVFHRHGRPWRMVLVCADGAKARAGDTAGELV